MREKQKEQVEDPRAAELEQATTQRMDVADQGTTNVFVGNLAPDVDESMLLREFGRFGPIASVKVMWPRDEEQRLRGRNTGFVCFMRREDAENAKQALDGVLLHDHVLALGWGKPVPLPKVPVWPPPEGVAALPPHKVMNRNASLAAGTVALAPESTRQRLADGPPPKEVVVGRGRDIEVTIPVDSRQRFVIDAVAFYVLRDGCAFEQAVMSNEQSNPEFAFLFDTASPEHVYYRWRLYSLANGDSMRSWRVNPFLMIEDSNRWIPPPMTLLAETGLLNGGEKLNSSKKDDVSLPDLAREKLLGMLQHLTVERKVICDAMVFILDHAEYATKISEIIIDSLTVPDISIKIRIARLFLLSDILYNTSAFVRNASKYRSVLQAALPDVFESLQEAYRGTDGRLAQELLRKHVLRVLKAWRGWYIFSDDFVNGLQATFLRGGVGPDGTRSTVPVVMEQAANRNPELVEMLNRLDDVEVEMKCKHSGLSRRGGREAMISRLLALDLYLHGDRNAKLQGDHTGEGDMAVEKLRSEDGEECITKRARNW